jgi:predicted unusual protein kinase regulating ubiquinone biosynthesis (AarF/ABC1/UbiB family)
VVGRAYLGIRSQRFIERVLDPPDMAERWHEQHETNARAIHRAAVELQGMILKGCQFVGARADVLPEPYIERLARLQDRVPPRAFPVVRRVVEHALAADLEDVFSSFDERPLAAASLAQVHGAVLHDGRRVAVKVQYPEIAQLVRSDLGNLRMLFGAIDWLEPDFDLAPLLEELNESVPQELDFVNEAHASERIAKELEGRSDVVIPGVVWEHTSRRVLVMERIDGIKITEVTALEAAGVDTQALGQTLVEVFCEQMLVNGNFHADPHPGNLMVLPGEDGGPARLVLLDFGLTKELPDEFRSGVVDFATALLQGDSDRMGKALSELGFETRDGEDSGLEELAAVLLGAAQAIRGDARVQRETIERLRAEIPAHVRENPIVRVPHHLVLVGRALALLSGVNSSLGAQVDFFRTIAPYALGLKDRAS